MAVSAEALHNVTAVFTGLNGRTLAVNDVRETIGLVRTRLRTAAELFSVEADANTMAWALQPIAALVFDTLADGTLDDEEVSLAIWNAYVGAVAKTKGADKFQTITADGGNWADMLAILRSYEGPADTAAPHFFGWRTVAFLAGIAALLSLMAQAPDNIATGRNRLYAAGIAALLWIGAGRIAFGLLQTPAPLTSKRLTVTITDDAVSVSSASSTIKKDNEELRVRLEEALKAQEREPPPGAPPLPAPVGPPPGLPTPSAAVASNLAVGGRIVVAHIPQLPGLMAAGKISAAAGCNKYNLLLDDSSTMQGVAEKYLAPEAWIEPYSTQCGRPCGLCSMECTQAPGHGTMCYCGCWSSPTAGELIFLPAVAAAQTPCEMHQQVYAPYAGAVPTRLKAQAGRLKEALCRAHSVKATMPHWPTIFWRYVEQEKQIYNLEHECRALLIANGYVGLGTISAPRFEELKKDFAALEHTGAPQHGAGASMLQDAAFAGNAPDEHDGNYTNRLPADLQRAAPEIFREIMSTGVSGLRGWVCEQFPLDKRDQPQFRDLFTSATSADFELAGANNEGEKMRRLGTSDNLEIILRKFASHIHYKRTNDKHAAERMLGIRAPGSSVDIAPKWMVDDAGTSSSLENRAMDRGRHQTRQDTGQTKGKPKGKGKGKGKPKGGGGAAGAAPAAQG